MVTKVLAGAHDTPEGRAAIRAAAAEAETDGAELHLVGFLERPKGEGPTASYTDDSKRLLHDVEEMGRRLVPDHLEVHSHVPTGVNRPSEAVLRVAAAESVDLIVIGLRQRSRVGKLLLGSNAQDILLAADCPVLAVKDD